MGMSFKQLQLNENMLQVVDALYFKKPTEIQKKAIPVILQGKHVVGHSQTGSGKTHAFLLPSLQKLDATKEEVQLVITAPTRELAIQLMEEIKTITAILGKEENWRSRLIVGGMDRPKMLKQLERVPHIVVGTPGRILDMIEAGALSIYEAKSFIIDEADLMLDMHFLDAIDQLLVRSRKDVQMLVFSATFSTHLQHFIKKYLQQPAYIQVESGLSPEQLSHRLIDKKHRTDMELMIQLAQVIQPYVAITFVNSKEKADDLSKEMKAAGFRVGVLHGGLSSRERTRTVKSINNLEYEYIVATDLASRGIDIKGASHVINVEMPKEMEYYVHRVGRTARAGGSGLAINFYTEADIQLIELLEKNNISFEYFDLKAGEWQASKRFDYRQKRQNVVTDVDREAWKQVRKTKKVKPGYKKKRKREQEQIKKRLIQEKNRQKKRR